MVRPDLPARKSCIVFSTENSDYKRTKKTNLCDRSYQYFS